MAQALDWPRDRPGGGRRGARAVLQDRPQGVGHPEARTDGSDFQQGSSLWPAPQSRGMTTGTLRLRLPAGPGWWTSRRDRCVRLHLRTGGTSSRGPEAGVRLPPQRRRVRWPTLEGAGPGYAQPWTFRAAGTVWPLDPASTSPVSGLTAVPRANPACETGSGGQWSTARVTEPG